MALFKMKQKKAKQLKDIKGKEAETNKVAGFNSPTEFLNDFEKNRGIMVSDELHGTKSNGDVSATVTFGLKQTELVSEEDKKVLNLENIEKIVSSLEIETIKPESVESVDIEEVKAIYDKNIKAHKKLLKKIPVLRKEVAEEVAVIKAKVPRIKQKKIRAMRRVTDKRISEVTREINEIRINISVLKEQIGQMARKFKSIEKQIVSNKATDRSVMRVVSSLSDESASAIKDNLKNFSDSKLSEKSRNMYNSVLVAIRETIGNIKVEIDKLTLQEEEKINLIKELEFDYQISNGRQSTITKDLRFAIKREQEQVEKLFELVLNVSSENVSMLQRKYNQLLIDAEEVSFEAKMDQMVRSIESTKMGLNFSKEISEITNEVGGIEDKHLSNDDVQEMTREVEVMIKGKSPKKVKSKKLKSPKNKK